MNVRIRKLRQQSLDAIPRISLERARLLSEFYQSDESKNNSIPVTRAKAFAYILKNKESDIDLDIPKTNMVLINAAAAIQIGGKAKTIKDGIELAQESIRSGSAYQKLKSLVKFSIGDLSKLEEFENNE